MESPPFTITNSILADSMSIAHLLGELDGVKMSRPKVLLRKSNTLKTIQASLAIEGNTLSLEQVSDLVEGVRVLAPEKDILEVKNAVSVYQKFSDFKFDSLGDFKMAHKEMMKGLIQSPGFFRTNNVGVFAGSSVAHIAPPYKKVPELMRDLFRFLKRKDEISLLIKSCIFHYELEFIHPFSDGNGRMGRLWQHLILTAYHPSFEFVAIESLIKEKQKEYYAVLGECDRKGDSTAFIEFSLATIKSALATYMGDIQYQPKTALDRLDVVRETFSDKFFSRKEYINVLKNISTATASRDLKLGVEKNILQKVENKRLTVYRFV